ncbi:thioredoxin family protein [Arenicella xantha]|uniref:AhpC/TSA family protein n=1 Tax=Arenicella xantha TaxID=644221 RepID=A0A395JPP2_9GAMM|nr:thioredoxin family protein [Arenicella xantha]RBP53467.1 AhpC/TSA family protein [Arenicella xantha]
MATVASTMPELGLLATDFSLPDVTKKNALVSLSAAQDQPLLLMFICNHCPYVLHLVEKMTSIANEAQANGFAVMAISSNDTDAYPQDGPGPMRDFAKQYGFQFPYLFDETQAVAKAYGAACTPDFFVYSRAHRLQYRGQMDNSRPSNSHDVSGADLTAALAAVLADKATVDEQVASIGCSIKWKPGNEPDYF